MYIVLGATGHVGSAVAASLIAAGEAVTIVTRDPAKARSWRSCGVEAAIVDVGDADALRRVLGLGRRAFLLNPPAPPATDTDAEEHRTLASIVRAVAGSGLESVVVQSTYGAQPGERCGDLGVLFDMEQALLAQAVPTAVLRGAYYMSNWDASLQSAKGGMLPTPYPPDLVIPMVAPADIGAVAARLLREPAVHGRIHHVEGPARYSATDAAAAFARALGRSVAVAPTPREAWVEAYRALGFSEPAAQSYARMTAVSVDGDYPVPADPERGATTLDAYIAALVRR